MTTYWMPQKGPSSAECSDCMEVGQVYRWLNSGLMPMDLLCLDCWKMRAATLRKAGIEVREPREKVTK